MGKYKYFLCIILWTFMPKICVAADLELSDTIREAREAQMKIAKSQIQENVEQTKQKFNENSDMPNQIEEIRNDEDIPDIN